MKYFALVGVTTLLASAVDASALSQRMNVHVAFADGVSVGFCHHRHHGHHHQHGHHHKPPKKHQPHKQAKREKHQTPHLPHLAVSAAPGQSLGIWISGQDGRPLTNQRNGQCEYAETHRHCSVSGGYVPGGRETFLLAMESLIGERGDLPKSRRMRDEDYTVVVNYQ